VIASAGIKSMIRKRPLLGLRQADDRKWLENGTAALKNAILKSGRP